MCSRGKTGSGGSFSAIHNTPIISGADSASGRNSTIFFGRAGLHDDIFYELGNHLSDEHSNPITDSLPSSWTENHCRNITGGIISSYTA